MAQYEDDGEAGGTSARRGPADVRVACPRRADSGAGSRACTFIRAIDARRAFRHHAAVDPPKPFDAPKPFEVSKSFRPHVQTLEMPKPFDAPKRVEPPKHAERSSVVEPIHVEPDGKLEPVKNSEPKMSNR